MPKVSDIRPKDIRRAGDSAHAVGRAHGGRNADPNGDPNTDPNGDALQSLRILDPAMDQPEYWNTFRAQVMDRVALELARRRAAARESISTVLSGWSRSLIPVAAAAAAIVGVLVATEMRRDSEPAPQLVLRDIMGDGADQQPPPFEAAASERTAGAAAFMALVEGGRR